MEIYLKTNDRKDFRPTFRKKAREDVTFLPDASFTSFYVTKLVFESIHQQTLCEYHRKGKDNFRADTIVELFGVGFKGESVNDAKKLSKTQEGHLHCGCPIDEVAMEFFLWKTTRAFSSNPKLAGKLYTMEALAKLKPSTRAFWNKSIRDYTGLQTSDLLSPDYGSDRYAMRIAILQLHTQIQRLRLLKAPVVVQVIFPDETDCLPREIFQYGIETGAFVMAKELEQYWSELNAKRQVVPLPFITPTRKQ